MPLGLTIKLCVISIFLILTPCTVLAVHLHKEKEYQKVWCEQAGGVMEYRLDDGTRVDCLTGEYAI